MDNKLLFYEFPVYILSEDGNDLLNWDDDGGQNLAVVSLSMVFVGDMINYSAHPASKELQKVFNTQKFIVTHRELRWVEDIKEEFPYTPTLYLKPFYNKD